MLQFFHKYQKSVVVYIFIGLILFSMAFFGVNMFDTGQTQYAMRIDDQEVSYRDVTERKQTFEAQLRQQFGDAFDSLWEFLSKGLNQRIVDSFIEEKLIDQVADRQHLAAADADIRETLIGLFQGQFSPALYQSYLNQRRLTAEQFESQLADQVKRAQFLNIITDLAQASDYEALRIGQRDESKIDLELVRFSPENFKSKVSELDEAAVLEYYEQNLNKYELAPRVKYAAVVVNPEDVLEQIELSQDDVDLYYTEHASEYKKPARAQVAQIQINFTQDASPEGMNSVRQKADEVRELALRGEDFTSLVSKYSDDIPSKLIAGNLGWIEEGSSEKGGHDDAIAKVALALKGTGVADLVSTEYGFHIVKVTDYEEAGSKDLAEVEQDVRKKLKELEAPVFALVKAEDILNRFQQSDLSLDEFAKAESLKLINTSEYLTADKDIDPLYTGLTSSILQNSSQAKQLIEIGNSNFVVSIIDFKDTELPGFEKVKDQVKNDLIEIKAQELARQQADKLLADLKEPENLSELAQASSLKVEKFQAVSNSSSEEALQAGPELKRTALRMGTPGVVGQRVYTVDSDYVVATVSKIDRPAADKLTKKLVEYRDQVTQNNSQALRTSLLKTLQSQAKIEVKPDLL